MNITTASPENTVCTNKFQDPSLKVHQFSKIPIARAPAKKRDPGSETICDDQMLKTLAAAVIGGTYMHRNAV